MKELERKYLEKNSIYYIENSLLSNITNQDIKEFIWSLYSEYKSIKSNFETKILKEIKSFKELSELDRYFIIETNSRLTLEWIRVKELENILKKFETRILRNNYKEYWNKTSYKKIDVNDIVITEVIGRYIKIPSNIRQNIKCPLHRDKTASFHIYDKTNSFYCFWCSKGWNAINFIAEIENISTKKAFKLFKNLYFK